MITANLYYRRVRGWNAYRLLVLKPEMARRFIPEQGYAKTNLLHAYVNHGRWNVKCECGATDYAWEEGFHMCQVCWNAKLRHKYRPVIFPKKRAEIERLLMVRATPNRNWNNPAIVDGKLVYPNETLAQLEAENKAHAAELLEVK